MSGHAYGPALAAGVFMRALRWGLWGVVTLALVSVALCLVVALSSL